MRQSCREWRGCHQTPSVLTTWEVGPKPTPQEGHTGSTTKKPDESADHLLTGGGWGRGLVIKLKSFPETHLPPREDSRAPQQAAGDPRLSQHPNCSNENLNSLHREGREQLKLISGFGHSHTGHAAGFEPAFPPLSPRSAPSSSNGQGGVVLQKTQMLGGIRPVEPRGCWGFGP